MKVIEMIHFILKSDLAISKGSSFLLYIRYVGSETHNLSRVYLGDSIVIHLVVFFAFSVILFEVPMDVIGEVEYVNGMCPVDPIAINWLVGD
jgi:hypothetical protein